MAGSKLLRLYVQILVVLVYGKHCWWSEGNTVRGVIRVPVVTSGRAGSSRGLAGGASLLMVAGCCVCCCDCTRIPSNEYDKEPFEEVAERRAGVKRSETN